MELSRRKFIGGLTGTVVAAQVNVVPASAGPAWVPTPVTKSFFPIMEVQTTGTELATFFLQTIGTSGSNSTFPTLGFECVRQKVSAEHEIEDAGQAEYEFLNRDWTVFGTIKRSNLELHDLISCGNKVELISKRGPGNIYFFHPDDAELMAKFEDELKTLGRRVIQNYNCPRNRIVSAYFGENQIDSPMHIVRDKVGQLFVARIPNGQINKYAQAIDLV